MDQYKPPTMGVHPNTSESEDQGPCVATTTPPPSAPPLPPPSPPPQPPDPASTVVGVPVPSSAPIINIHPHLAGTTQSENIIHVRAQAQGRWSSGLFDCTDDVGNCCLTCFCPCITFGRVAEIVDRGSTSCGVSGALYAAIMCLTGWSCLYSCFYRSKLRGMFFLEESPCCDCLVHCCCESCALCQEHRELRIRGFNPSKGWQRANESLVPRGMYVPPMVQGAMSR